MRTDPALFFEDYLFEVSIRDGQPLRLRIRLAETGGGGPPGHGDPLPFNLRQLLEGVFGGEIAYCGPLPPGLSDFAASVLEETRRIPFGETLTYGELAKRIGRPRAARAVGGALGRNPLPFLIPCHRVVGQGGALTGYTEGVEIKSALLAWEKTLIAP
ncbi:MAG: MGMT family protein [Nitrospiraceae bacterium]|jgi:methylated-DNA-[protein]-cysteine S-methyltransferase|nr:MGMT family protein [Nitrospiraceae bacterium]